MTKSLFYAIIGLFFYTIHKLIYMDSSSLFSRKITRFFWKIAFLSGLVVFLVALYHAYFEPFREQHSEYLSWLPNYDIREKVTVIEKKEQTTVTEDDFVPKLIVNAQNISVTVVAVSPNLAGFVLSGFFVTNDGVVAIPLENFSGVEKTYQYTVFTLDGETFNARWIGADPFTETAFLRSEKTHSSTLAVAPEDAFFSGRKVLSIAKSQEGKNPVVNTSFLSEWGATTNIARQSVGLSEKYEGVAKIGTGSPIISGSAVVTYQGELLGMARNFSKANDTQTVIIPFRAITSALERMREEGDNWSRPFLGISFVSLTPELAKKYDLSETRGAWVKVPGTSATVVLFNSPAFVAGIQQGDIITAVNGKEISLDTPLSLQIAEFHPGETVTLSVLRGGSKRDVSVTLGRNINF